MIDRRLKLEVLDKDIVDIARYLKSSVSVLVCATGILAVMTISDESPRSFAWGFGCAWAFLLGTTLFCLVGYVIALGTQQELQKELDEEDG